MMHPTLPTDRQVYRIPIRVEKEDIDDLGHVNNVVYLQWIQDISYAHWNAAAPQEVRNDCKWVVLKHEIDYHEPAMPDDSLEAFTWIEKPEGARQKRMVRIFRSHDQKLLTSSATTWCLLDPKTDRPKRVSVELSALMGLKY